MSYEDMSIGATALLDAANALADAGSMNTANLSPEQKIRGLQTLVAVLESGLEIVRKRYYIAVPDPEPFPGAVGVVVQHALGCVDLARKTNLIPERKS